VSLFCPEFPCEWISEAEFLASSSWVDTMESWEPLDDDGNEVPFEDTVSLTVVVSGN
jgi:hypothetical protein